jgi:two-component system chemotaxis response regulator CheB
VIDDSAFSRRTITRILKRSPLVEVVGCASDGEEALRKTFNEAPDLITLDLEMPKMDGFTYLRLVMSRFPTPVIVISRQSRDHDVFKALELGAVDFIAKPTPRASPGFQVIEQELLRKVHAVRQLRIENVRRGLAALPRPAPSRPRAALAPELVAVGASTGGPASLMQIFSSFLEAPPVAILVSQHMPLGFTRGLAERLDRVTPFEAREAEEGDEPRPGTILIAPGGWHMELHPTGERARVHIAERGLSDEYVPGIDRLFMSSAKHYGPALLAIVLTGMGSDGREGVRAVKRAGGSVIAESEDTAVIYGMPLQAIRTGSVDVVLPLEDISDAIRSGVAADHAPAQSHEGLS